MSLLSLLTSSSVNPYIINRVVLIDLIHFSFQDFYIILIDIKAITEKILNHFLNIKEIV